MRNHLWVRLMTTRDKEYTDRPENGKQNTEYCKLDKLFLDATFFSDPKIIALTQTHGGQAVAYLINCYSVLGQASQGIIPRELLVSLGCHWGFTRDTSEVVVQYFINLNLLHGDTNIYHPRICAEQKKIASQRLKWQNRQKCHRGVTRTSGRDSEEEKEQEEEKELDLKNNSQLKPDKPEKFQFGESGHVWLTATESTKLQNKYGTEVVARCIEKLDAWIEQDPTPKRRQNGKNAAATFRSWVIAEILKQQVDAKTRPKTGTTKKSNYEEGMEILMRGSNDVE